MEERWQTLVDKIIQEATERGEFEVKGLKGKKLQDDPTEVHAGDRAMAHKVLANSGYAPPFLMKKREIETALERERERLARYALRRRRLHADAAATPDEGLAAALHDRAEADWGWAVAQFEKALPDLNKQIELFNLMNQIPTLHKLKLRLDREIERAEQQAAEG